MQWVSWCTGDVYEPWRYSYFKINGAGYHYIITGIIKNEAINLLLKIGLSKRVEQ